MHASCFQQAFTGTWEQYQNNFIYYFPEDYITGFGRKGEAYKSS